MRTMRAGPCCVKGSGPSGKWRAADARGSVPRMKGLAIAVSLCALAGALLFWPVSGRSFWRRASDRGLPQAAARMTARGLGSVWGALSGSHAPARTPPRKPVSVARVQARPPAPEKSRPARAAEAEPAAAIPVRAAGFTAGPDRIVAQPARERLGQDDRNGLDQLLRTR